MKVNEVMHQGVQVIAAHMPVRIVAATMRDADVGALPVVDGGRIIGIVTDRDLTVRSLADGLDIDTLTARDVMSRGVVCCGQFDDLAAAAALMERHQVRRLPVLDLARRPVGMLSFGDLAHAHRSDLTDEVAKSVAAHHG